MLIVVLVNRIIAYGHCRSVKRGGTIVWRDNIVQRKKHTPCEATAFTIVRKERQTVGSRILAGKAKVVHSQLVLHEIKEAKRLLFGFSFGTVALKRRIVDVVKVIVVAR